MKIPSILFPLAVAVEDESTLLSLHRVHVNANAESESQHLLEAATSRNVTQMQALIQNLVQESIQGDGIAELDEDIKEAMKVIQDTLLKGIKNTLLNEHRQDQVDIMEQLSCFDGCRATRTKSERICNEHVRKFEYLKDSHVSCRTELRGKYIAKIQSCNALDVWVDGFTLIKKPEEYCVYAGQYVCHNAVCQENECNPDIKEEFGKWLKRIIGQATAGYNSWIILHGRCRADYHAYIALDSKCDVTEKEMERTNGELRQCEYTACNVEYTKCRADCIAEYHKIVKRVECAEKDRKIDWSSTEKIECYIRILLNSPTNEELQSVCEDGQNCISKWRTHEYNKCSAVCPNVDYGAKDAEYEQHARRDAQTGEYLHINEEGTTGLDAGAVIPLMGGSPYLDAHESTQAHIQHADDAVAGDRSLGVNTTHRRKDGGDEARCTWHLDIDFQPIPCAIPCLEPRPCCDDEYRKMYLDQFMRMIEVSEVSNVEKCHDQHPGEHTEKWAYNLCDCCYSHCLLVGTPAITDDDYCPCPSHGERPEVYMEYKQTNVCLHTREEAPGTITLPQHMCVDRVEITHASGHVNCRKAESGESKWGCDENGVVVVLAKAGERTVTLPTLENTAGMSYWRKYDTDTGRDRYADSHWYSLDGVDKNSDMIVFQTKDGVYDLKMEGEYKLWYGEDLHNWTESDNSGRVCYDVEVFGEWC